MEKYLKITKKATKVEPVGEQDHDIYWWNQDSEMPQMYGTTLETACEITPEWKAWYKSKTLKTKTNCHKRGPTKGYYKSSQH